MGDLLCPLLDYRLFQNWQPVMFDLLLICAQKLRYCPYFGPINSVLISLSSHNFMFIKIFILYLLNFLLSVNIVSMEGFMNMEGLTFTHEDGGVTVTMS
jgi:hypothetical protein